MYFFVKKKDGSIRLIFDTRGINFKFNTPPNVRLPSTSAFASVEVPEGFAPFMASGDVSNAFYRIGVPECLQDIFSLPCILAKHLGVDFCTAEVFSPNDVLLPCLTVLVAYDLELVSVFLSKRH